MSRQKVIIIGLDCATPQFMFDQWRDKLPNLSKLMQAGIFGDLQSTLPPITVPAWTSMMTSLDAGQLGVYGFRNRKDYSYDALYFANSTVVNEPTVWQILSQAGKRSIVIGVPQTYPTKPLNGLLVSCFLTPDKKSDYTYPQSIKTEIDQITGGYIIDVEDFRTENKDKLLAEIYQMTERRFKLVRHYDKTSNWDVFMFVEMGVDRIHHGFWRFGTPAHRLYEPGNKYEYAIRDYYIYLDQEIGSLLELLDDDTLVLVVSDHGAKTMVGGIAINEWLMQKGYLHLKEQPAKQTPLKTSMIDWSKTVAWGEGGYYSRIFMNVKEREPQGIIPKSEYQAKRDELARAMEGITDDHGHNIGTKVCKPQDVYRECRNVPPDLIVYLGNLDWRSIGSIGTGKIQVYENDTGPDDANHAEQGIFIMTQMSDFKAGISNGAKREGLSIYDVAPTVLSQFGLPLKPKMIGKVINL